MKSILEKVLVALIVTATTATCAAAIRNPARARSLAVDTWAAISQWARHFDGRAWLVAGVFLVLNLTWLVVNLVRAHRADGTGGFEYTTPSFTSVLLTLFTLTALSAASLQLAGAGTLWAIAPVILTLIVAWRIVVGMQRMWRRLFLMA